MDAEARVYAAADELFAACQRERFPSVYDVRKLCGVGMPATNRAMQTWRARQLLSIAKPLEVAIPSALQDAGKNALGQLWAAAIEISRESLIAAQRGFDEKAALARASDEDLVAAFETQRAELDALRSEYDIHRTTSSAALADNQHELQDIRAQLILFRDQANTAVARLEETRKQVNDLKVARDREQAIAKKIWDESMERAKRDENRVSGAQKREKSAVEASARCRGQWESLKAQYADLLGSVELAKSLRRQKTTT
jgi:colicin import membrane protein